MTTFTIDPDNNITAFANPQEAETAASGESFASQDALDTLSASWPMDRFATVWNSFAGVAGVGADLQPVKKFENRNKAVARIWKALQRLNGDATARTLPPQKRPTLRPRARRASAGRASRGRSPPLPVLSQIICWWCTKPTRSRPSRTSRVNRDACQI
jgi:hypothetical protein